MFRKRLFIASTAGFSLIELLVSIAIAGALVSIAWARMSTLAPIYTLEGAASDLAAEIQKARGSAIAQNLCFTVVIDTTAKTYLLQSKSTSSATCGTTGYATPAGEGTKQIDGAGSIAVAFTQGSNPIFTPRGAVENNPSPVIRLTNDAGGVRSIYVQSNARIHVR